MKAVPSGRDCARWINVSQSTVTGMSLGRVRRFQPYRVRLPRDFNLPKMNCSCNDAPKSATIRVLTDAGLEIRTAGFLRYGCNPPSPLLPHLRPTTHCSPKRVLRCELA